MRSHLREAGLGPSPLPCSWVSPGGSGSLKPRELRPGWSLPQLCQTTALAAADLLRKVFPSCSLGLPGETLPRACRPPAAFLLP